MISWYLALVVITGTFSADAKMNLLPFFNKEACIKAGTDIIKVSSKNVGGFCFSSETGETIEIKR